MTKGLSNLLERLNEPNGHWIEKKATNYLRSKQRQSKYTGFFNPSSCGQELRKLFLDFSGKSKQEFNDSSLWMMDSGNWGHEKYYSYFELSGILLAKEVHIRVLPPDSVVPISGRFDALLKSPQGEEYLLDIKTTNYANFNSIKIPDYGTLVQWILYSWLFMVPKGGILYENRNMQPVPFVKVFDLEEDNGSVNVWFEGVQIHREECLLQNTIKKMEIVYNLHKSASIPSRCDKCRINCPQREVCEDL